MAASSHYKYLAVILLAALGSCSKEPLTNKGGETHINATISNETKTSLDGLSVKWTDGDMISVFTESSSLPSGFSLESGAGSQTALFSGNLSNDPTIVLYPYNAEDRYVNGIISTEMSDRQAYAPGGFANNVSPMAAIPDGNGNACFKNLCSVIRLTLTGEAELEEIVLSCPDEGSYLAGPAKISIIDGNPVLKVVDLNKSKASIHTSGDAYPYVHLDCNSVKLSLLKPSVFCIVVPSQVYESGITIEVCTKVGKYIKQTRKLDLRNSTLYDIEPFEVKINGGIVPSTFLYGLGTQSSPFLVSSAADLIYIQKMMASSGRITNEKGSATQYAQRAWYLLTNDIDLSTVCGPNTGSWQRLTVKQNEFTGHFDGDGHKITNLYISSSDDGGSFFGDVYSNGYLGNLEVSGTVMSGDGGSIVCGSICGTVENCIARGSITSFMTSGGLAETNFGIMKNCTNYANVSSTSQYFCGVGGIAGSSISCTFDNCVNYGTIYSVSGGCLGGGITGRTQQSKIINCSNYGEITGTGHSAGIVGSMFDTDVLSCVNYGNIHGANSSSTLCAGICGEQNDPFNHQTGTIRNCINLGSVDNGLTNCGICAKNARVVQYCYWLYDTDCGMATGVSGGSSTGLVSLDVAQMQGKSKCPSLYGGYQDLVDALNAFGFDNSSSEVKLQGWAYSTDNAWPALNGRSAIPPGQTDKFIKTNPTKYTLNTYAQSIDLIITSSSEVTLVLPSWISQKSVKSEQNDKIRYSTFLLDVQLNKTGSERSANIAVNGTDGSSATVAVIQRYTYLSEDYTRNGNVITLQKASEGNGIDLVLMGDAYTDKDIKSGKYESDIKRGIDAFFSVEPYASFRNLFNIYYVELISESSVIGSSTAVGTFFGEGTLVGGNDATVRNHCTQITKKSNLDDVTAVVIINSYQYAGTCYMYYSSNGDHAPGFSVSYFPLGTASTGQTSMEALIRHEAGGHGFGKLADEYSYQNYGAIPESEITSYRERQTYGWWPNVDFTSDPFQVRWSKYIQDNRYANEQISVFEGGATYWTGVWRPTLNSIMRYNTGQFNAPSREAIYYKIHRLAYGSTWQFDYESFVKYDAVNRSATAVKSGAPSYEERTNFRPTHPPVLVRE